MTAMPAPLQPSDDQNDLHWEDGLLVIPIAKARTYLAELANQAAYAKDRIILTLRGRRIAAIVPIDDVEQLESMEDRADLAAIDESKAAGEYDAQTSWEEIKREAGLE